VLRINAYPVFLDAQLNAISLSTFPWRADQAHAGMPRIRSLPGSPVRVRDAAALAQQVIARRVGIEHGAVSAQAQDRVSILIRQSGRLLQLVERSLPVGLDLLAPGQLGA